MKKAVFSYIVMFVTMAALVLWPKIFPITGDELGYAVIAYIVVFPLVSLAASFLSGLSGVLYGLMCTFLAGAGSLAMPLMVFGATGREYMLIPVAASAFGLAVGLAAARAFERRRADKSGK